MSLDGDGLSRGRAGLGLDLGQLHVEIAVVDGADLSGDADHGQAVGAVGRDLAIEDRIGATEVLGKRHAHGRVRGQNPDALVVAGQAKLALGAVHAAGYDAAQLALLDVHVARQFRADHGGHDVVALIEVLRAAHNLQGLGVAVGVDVVGAHVDQGDPQVVGIGVCLLGDHLRRDDLVICLAHRVDGLDLGAGADELAGELRGILRQLNHRFQPFVRNLHLKPLLKK